MTFPPRHDGSAAATDRAFPYPPSPSIGAVRSQDSNVPSGEGAVGAFFRGLDAGTLVTYVGERGVHRITRGVFGAPTETVVSFSDAERMEVERSRFHRAGTYQYTSVNLRFFGAPKSAEAASPEDDVPIAHLALKYYDSGKPPRSDEPVHFYEAVERAWNAHATPRLLAAFRERGVIEIRGTHGWVVRVSRTDLQAGYLGRVMRSRARTELGALWVEAGKLLASPPLGNHAEVTSSASGNFHGLLAVLLEAGYPLR